MTPPSIASCTVREILRAERLQRLQVGIAESARSRGKTSRMPHNSPPSSTGRTTMDRIPRSRQAIGVDPRIGQGSRRTVASRESAHTRRKARSEYSGTPQRWGLCRPGWRGKPSGRRGPGRSRLHWRLWSAGLLQNFVKRRSRARSAGNSSRRRKVHRRFDSDTASAESGSIHSGPLMRVWTARIAR